MTIDGSNPDFDQLRAEAEKMILAPFELALASMTERYLQLSRGARASLEEYSRDLEKGEKPLNRSRFLFETIDASTQLFELIESRLSEEAQMTAQEEYDKILEEILVHFSLREKEGEKSADGFYVPDDGQGKPRIATLPGEALKGIRRFFRRKKLQEDYVRNYFLNKVYLVPMERTTEDIGELLGDIAVLITEVWKVSNIIHQKADKMIRGDSGTEVETGFSDFSIDLTEVTKLEQAVEARLREVLDQLKKEIAESFGLVRSEGGIPSHEEHEHRKKYSARHTSRLFQRLFRQTERSVAGWERTLMLLADDWLLELEIARLKYYIMLHSFEFGSYVRTRFTEPLNENFKLAEEVIAELIRMFEKAGEGAGNTLIEELKVIRTNVKRKLVLKLVPEVKRIILDSNIPARIDEYEQSATEQFTQLSKSRNIKKKPIYNEPTDAGDVDRISPSSLVSFQMMPEFMGNFPYLKQSFTRHLQEIQNRIEEIPEIIDYSLLTSLNFAEEKKNSEEAEKIGLEGVKRAENKLKDLKSMIEDFIREETTQFMASIQTLAEHLSEITDNESALQIKIRIAKARAIEASKEFKRKIIGHFKNFIPEIRQLISRFLDFLKESSNRIRKQFSLDDQKHYISTDVSDYLTETEKAIDRLPFIYQRLFKPEALTTFELFTDRPEELEKIKTAYTRWKAGKFAPTAIIGEKGWGKTSLINRFLKLKITTEEIVRFLPDPSMKVEDLYEAILAKTTFKDNGNGDHTSPRKIIVLDGLERLFEARINGFQVMLNLLQHISESNAHLFWIITCHLHSWQYLDKTLAISDYFGYHIKLSDFSNEALMRTIERRHNISGYRLLFLPETQKKSLISFKKQSDFGDQKVLREEYFNRMHKIVKGNLAQAFLFWMRSTAHVTEDSVYIEYLSSEYFNFLGSMSDKKLMILKFIVLQNGLDSRKFSVLLRLPEEKGRLLLDQLYDDGILVRKDDLYNINPIIYRQVIEQLYLLNILH